MSNKIYIKRSVKEKLPEKTRLYHVFNTLTRYDSSAVVESTRLFVAANNIGWQGIKEDQELGYEITHWLEEVPLEEYLKEIGLEIKIKESNECEECKKSDSLRFDGHRYICTRCEIDL